MVDAVATQYQKLNSEWSKKGRNTETVGSLLNAVKLALTKSAFLPTMKEDPASVQELLIARDTLEIGAFYSIEVKDVKGFERYMAQLKTYYSDYEDAGEQLKESPYKYELLGLNLLCLLSQNRMAEFHMELELLPSEVLLGNPYVRTPVSLEQHIMEGNYKKVLIVKDNVPSPYYTFFIDKMLDTIRDEMGSCIEKAYERISLSGLTQMLNLTPSSMKNYIKEKEWNLNNDNYVYFKTTTDIKKSEVVEVPSLELAQMAITYAKEMEQIV